MPKKKPKVDVRPTNEIEPKGFQDFMAKGSRTVHNHKFKLHLNHMLKNSSWKFRVPKIYKVEHTHFYRTIGRRGNFQLYSTLTGGHGHLITIDWNITEEVEFKDPITGQVWKVKQPKVTCGPAIKEVKLKVPGREFSKKKLTSVTYEVWEGSDQQYGSTGEGNVRIITDTHTHKVEYEETEEENLDTRQKIVQLEKEKVSKMMDVGASPQPEKINQMANADAQGVGKEG